MSLTRSLVAAALIACSTLSIGCETTRTAYYNAWEKLGYAKRERLTDNVKAARAEQDAAKKQFASALDEFKSVVNYNDGTDLQKAYDTLNASCQRCETQADAVNSKITSVKNVATSLFTEWQGEVKEISDPSLKSQSQTLYDQTKANYDELIARMDTAAGSMVPVLTKFKDRVLFLKGGLNAQALASLRGTEASLGTDIDKLIKDMEASIAEADAFIAKIGPKS